MRMHNNGDTKQRVLDMLREKSTLSYSVIANQLGVTRERVRQIAQQNGYPPRIGKVIIKICPVCGDTYHSKNIYCSPACRHEAMRRRIVVTCHRCGKPIERTPGSMRSKSGKYFCNRVCFGK